VSIIAATPQNGTRLKPSDRQSSSEAGPGDPGSTRFETTTRDPGEPETAGNIEDLALRIISSLGCLAGQWRTARGPGDPLTAINGGFSAASDNPGPRTAIPDIGGPPPNDVVPVPQPANTAMHTPTEITEDPDMPAATLETEKSFPELVSQLSMTARPAASSVLHVGCGEADPAKLPSAFRRDGWNEIRLDIDAEVRPDFVASITDMNVIAGGSMDAVYSSHNLEHLYPHEVPLALREMHRVLSPAGFALIKVPDLQEVARHVAEGHLEDPLYVSTMGPISAIDILFGHRASLVSGNLFMAHRTGFTGVTLGSALISAGFAAVMVQRNPAAYALAAVAFKNRPDEQVLAGAQALMLPDPDLPAVLYARAG
jgi:SAM-dependent methyltransferase